MAKHAAVHMKIVEVEGESVAQTSRSNGLEQLELSD